MKKKILWCNFCIIIDAVYVAIGIYHEAPVSDYILMGIFFPIIDFLFLALVGFILEDSENECLVIQLPDAVDDDELPKLK